MISIPPQSVTLTKEAPNKTFTFYYSKILGSITIHYIDESTNDNISDSKTINNLSLGSYTYGFININGYTLNDDQPKTITLAESNPNVTIPFKYKEILGSITINYLDEANNNLSDGVVNSKFKFM